MMQVIIPLAGLGTRLRPHTLIHPKPLIAVAGKPMLDHIIDRLRGMPIAEVIFITGHLGEQIDAWAARNCPFPWRSVVQTELRGQAHAIALARDLIHRPLLIIFADTIFDADIERLSTTPDDGVLFVREVEDPRRFGVAVVEQGRIVRLVEKPQEFVSRSAIVGVYYVRDGSSLMRSIDRVIARDLSIGGEFYLADALQDMIEAGARFSVSETRLWADCGTVDALIETNATLLARDPGASPTSAPGSRIVPPVAFGPGVTLADSTVGPNVTLGQGVTVTGTTIRDSIVGSGTRIVDGDLTHSLIGAHCTVKGVRGRLNIADHSDVEVP